jgi:hypothetical protein
MEDQQLSQELILYLDRLTDEEFADPKLDTFAALTPVELASNPKEFLTSIVQHFDAVDNKATLNEGEDHIALLSKAIKSSQRPRASVYSEQHDIHEISRDFMYFGVTAGNELILRSKMLWPYIFNVDNKVVYNLMPKLLVPARKYTNEQTEEGDYI